MRTDTQLEITCSAVPIGSSKSLCHERAGQPAALGWDKPVKLIQIELTQWSLGCEGSEVGL